MSDDTLKDRVSRAWVLVSVAVAAMFACSRPVQELKMKPMRFVAVQTPGGLHVELADPQALFDRATKFLKQKRYKEAWSRYRVLLKYYPGHALAVPARYNTGLCLSHMKRYKEAARAFEAYLKAKDLSRQDRCDGMEKLGEVLSKLKRPRDAINWLMRVDKNCTGTVFARIRTKAKIAHEYNQLHDPAMAMHFASRAMRLYRINKESPGMSGYYFAAMAYYEYARAYAFMFRNIKLYLPMDRMEKDLTDKAQYFLSAQSAFLNAIRVHNIYFGIRSGMAIGKLYEDFYNDLMSAEVPAKFTPEQRKIYFEELKKDIRPLVRKAEIVYQQNLRVGKYYKVPQKWMQEARKRLEKLKQLLQEPK